MTTIAIAIVGRAITIWEAILNRSQEPIYKTYTKSKDNKSDNFCFHNVGRAITKWGAILEKLLFLKGTKNYFAYLFLKLHARIHYIGLKRIHVLREGFLF